MLYFRSFRENAAINGQRCADQESAEQESFDVKEGENPTDLIALPREQVVWFVAKRLPDNPLPSGKMAKSTFRMVLNVLVPCRSIIVRKFKDF
jgi:hypothetical protein